MDDLPGSPRAARLARPGWLDARLVLGVLLVLVSVVAGARVVSAGDRTEQVWVAARDLPPGAVLSTADLELRAVRLDSTAGGYVGGPPPVGWTVTRGLFAGELVPSRALTQEPSERHQVTVSVGPGDAPPDLARGQLVDVLVTPEGQPSRRVLERVTVAFVPEASGFSPAGETRSVVLDVDPDEVLELVSASAAGPVDLVRLPADARR